MKKISMTAVIAALALTVSAAMPLTSMASETVADQNTEITVEAEESTENYANELFALVNEERAKAGLAPYILDDAVVAAADTRVLELEDIFSHKRSGEKHFSTILNESGISFTAASETIAAGQTTPAAALSAWFESSRHRGHILSTKYTRIAIAHDRNENGTDYWVMLFLN